jgi:hypothetical protein
MTITSTPNTPGLNGYSMDTTNWLNEPRLLPKLATAEKQSRSKPAYAFLTAGTGIPAILSFTEPRKFQLVKYSVFQSGPPKAMLVVCG